MYHGMLFGPDGMCREIPGQDKMPKAACLRTYPVVEKDNWIWVWMGDAAAADPALICFSVGPGEPEWNFRTAKVHVNANYRLQLANLGDLSHSSWTHEKTFGGTLAYSEAGRTFEETPRGVNTEFWLYNQPAPNFSRHLFPPETRFDTHYEIQMTVPCNFIMRVRSYSAGDATEGPSNGELGLETYTCQAVTPRDDLSVDYYYSWGVRRDMDRPGLTDLLKQAIDRAFLEDKEMLEAQQQRMLEKPDWPMLSIIHDLGPTRMLRALDRLIRSEEAAMADEPVKEPQIA
jgi:vanillate O-demethylase monooxygenase subunit